MVGNSQIGSRGDPKRAATMAGEPLEHGQELLGAADDIFVLGNGRSARSDRPGSAITREAGRGSSRRDPATAAEGSVPGSATDPPSAWATAGGGIGGMVGIVTGSSVDAAAFTGAAGSSAGVPDSGRERSPGARAGFRAARPT